MQNLDLFVSEYKTFSQEYNIVHFVAERALKKNDGERVIVDSDSGDYKISLDIENLQCKVENDVDEDLLKQQLQQAIDNFVKKCSFRRLSKRGFLDFINDSISQSLGIKAIDLDAIDVQRREGGVIMARFSHNYFKDSDFEIE